MVFMGTSTCPDSAAAVREVFTGILGPVSIPWASSMGEERRCRQHLSYHDGSLRRAPGRPGLSYEGGGGGGAVPASGAAAPRGAWGYGRGPGRQPLRLHLGPAEEGQGRGGVAVDPPVWRRRGSRRGLRRRRVGERGRRCETPIPPEHRRGSGRAAAPAAARRQACACRAGQGRLPPYIFRRGGNLTRLQSWCTSDGRLILAACSPPCRMKKFKNKNKMRGVPQPTRTRHLAFLQPPARLCDSLSCSSVVVAAPMPACYRGLFCYPQLDWLWAMLEGSVIPRKRFRACKYFEGN